MILDELDELFSKIALYKKLQAQKYPKDFSNIDLDQLQLDLLSDYHTLLHQHL